MIPDTAVRQLKSSLRGPTFSPGDLGYEQARTVPNAMIDRRPAIIARCASAADVIACVRFAREQDVVVSVRGGGHSVAGKSVCEAGLMIDLSAMKGIRVDPAKKTVRAEAGLKLGEFDRQRQGSFRAWLKSITRFKLLEYWKQARQEPITAGTLFWIDPEEQLIAIYMVQVSDPDRVELRNRFRTMVQAAIME